MAVNSGRVLVGAIAGGVVWSAWSACINLVALEKRYAEARQTGLFLKHSRYPLFVVYWIVLLFVLSYIVAWLYASVGATRGAGPGTALQVGILVGFASGFPGAFGASAWLPFSRYIPLWQMLELWVGAILAAVVAGWIYRY